METALKSIRVLEWSYFHMGPAAGSILGDLGAEVVKIEEPETGDPMRGLERIGGIPVQTSRGSSTMYDSLNRNKKSIALNLRKPEGREILYRMLPKFDIFITTFRRKATESLGLDYETLKRHNPRLIYFHGSAYGPAGPDRDKGGQDFNGQARSGFALAQRCLEDGPWACGGIADEVSGMIATIGILAALQARERLGVGQKVDASLLGSMIMLERTVLSGVLATGQDAKPFSQKLAGSPLYNFYRASDGKWLCLSFGAGMDKQWPNLCKALEAPELQNDPRFHDTGSRRDNNKELIAILDEVFKKYSRDEWLKRLYENDIVASVVNCLSEVVNDPQVMENQYLIEYDDHTYGKRKGVGFPLTMSETPMRMITEGMIPGVAAEIGQHTEEVLLELGGYDWDEITKFREKGVL